MQGPVKNNARARNYVFTLNFGEEDPHQLTPEEDDWGSKGVKYCVWQLEVGENANLHIQGRPVKTGKTEC